MMLSDLIKRLKDMELLYEKAIVYINIDGKEYKIISIDGFTGKQHVGGCKDPNIVSIKARKA